MWGDSWINLSMKMMDMPYYHYDSDTDEQGEKKGTVDDLRKNFGKYIKR